MVPAVPMRMAASRSTPGASSWSTPSPTSPSPSKHLSPTTASGGNSGSLAHSQQTPRVVFTASAQGFRLINTSFSLTSWQQPGKCCIMHCPGHLILRTVPGSADVPVRIKPGSADIPVRIEPGNADAPCSDRQRRFLHFSLSILLFSVLFRIFACHYSKKTK